MSTADVKVDRPLTVFVSFLEAIKLQWIDDAFVFWARYFIEKLYLFKTDYSILFDIIDATAFGIFEEDSRWPVFEYALQ